MSKRRASSPKQLLGQLAALGPGFFKALAEPSRAAILSCLANARRACTVSEVAEQCPVDVSVVSRHLAVLRDAGILSSEKRGREVFYSLDVRHVAATLRSLADALEACCGPGAAANPPKE